MKIFFIINYLKVKFWEVSDSKGEKNRFNLQNIKIFVDFLKIGQNWSFIFLRITFYVPPFGRFHEFFIIFGENFHRVQKAREKKFFHRYPQCLHTRLKSPNPQTYNAPFQRKKIWASHSPAGEIKREKDKKVRRKFCELPVSGFFVDFNLLMQLCNVCEVQAHIMDEDAGEKSF